MPDMQVKVSADISQLLTKVDAARAKLNQLTEENRLLKAELKDLNQSLKKNDSAIAKLNTEISKSTAVTKEDRAAVAALRKEREILVASGKKIQASIKTTTADLAVNTSQLKIHAAELKKTETAGNAFVSGANKVYSGLRKIAYIIPGLGIAGLISLISGPLIDAFQDWYEAANRLSDAQQLLKDNIKNTSDINKAAGEDIAKQTASLSSLYSIATDVSRSMYARVGAVQALQKEFPAYFKNISQENILNGNAKSAYDALTDSLIANALAKAQLDKITNLGINKSDVQSQIDDLIAERKRQLDAVKNAIISTPSLGNSTGAPSTTITPEQQKADINTYFDRQLIPLQAKIKSFDAQINSIRSKFNPAALLNGDDSSKAEPAPTGILAVFDAQIKVLEDYKKNIATTASEIASVNAQIKKLQEERAKYDPTASQKKNIETIEDVLKKLAIQIDFLNQKELLLKTSQASVKINAIESTINTLMQKFKLLADNPVIISLEAKINDINLTEQFKKVLKGDKNETLKAPMDTEVDPQIKLQPGWSGEQVLREEILKKLDKLGIKKTIPITIKGEITGDITLGSEKITKNTSTDKLKNTFNNAKTQLEAFNDAATDIVNKMATDMAVSIGEALGNAFKSNGNAVKGLFDGIFSTLGDTLQELGRVAIKTGLGIEAIKTAIKSLNPYVAIAAGIGLVALGSVIKNSVRDVGGFATGGLIRGAGSPTGDSVLARVSPGEFIVRAASVSKFGLNFFDKINKGMMPKFDSLGFAKFATGGFVSPNSVNLPRPISLPNISIGGGQQIFIAESKLRGQDIVTSFKRASATISRNS